MDNECATMHEMMSGYLDDELDDAETKRFDEHIKSCAECRRELTEMTEVISVTSELGIEEPEEEVWDEFLGNVYHRLERKTGWYLVVIAVVLAASMGIYFLFLTDILPFKVKMVIEMFFIGLALLFSSVMRQRTRHRKTDRYSRDVHR